ncbi:uncharacterized protein LOC112556981 [Pomacea canaliculata]|uniref:uncharacterized protein LOC112556981 n=1 Tax=Pomacea canaliculata TaxID=400727 RepID=UPI000D72C9AE|nr:uncharacterized protein LOC112556981 [Pomacea canaliculata]
MACLWRRRTFVFPGSKTQQVCNDGFLREHGQHVQHVILEFEFQNNAALQCFQAFIDTANECAAFRSIKVRHLCFSYLPKRWTAYRPKMVQALCLLLKRQPMLQEADFYLCQFTHNEGLQVLKALTGDLRLMTRRNIITLKLEQFYDPQTLDISLRTFTEVMGRFSALACLCLDQHYLCEAVLDKLITGCAQTLRHLDIVMNTTVVHAIDSHTWSLAVQRCPSLTVSVRLYDVYTFEEYSRVLVESMPLTRVSFWNTSGIPDIRFSDVARFLRHVCDIFFNTIEVVGVSDNSCLTLGLKAEGYRKMCKAVVKLIETSLQLKRLYLCIPLMPGTLDKLSRVLAARAQNEMKRLEVTVVVDEEMNTKYIEQRWPRLRALSFDELLIDDF